MKTNNCLECNTEFESKANKLYCKLECRNKAYRRNISIARHPGLSTGTTGAMGELLASADLLSKGYEVFRAVSPACSCDLIGMKNGVLSRFEVRTGSENTKTGKKNFARERFQADHYAVIMPGYILYEPELQ